MLKEFKILDAYEKMFYSDKNYFLISGGRGSGKSTQVAAYFLIKLLGDEFFRGVVSRFSAKSVKFSIYQDIIDLATDWGILSSLQLAGEEIVNPENENKIITHSFRISDNTQIAKSKGLARATHLIIDEAQELPSEEEYIKVIDSFRTKGVERKIFIVFNPTSKRHWIHKRFYIDGRPNPKWEEDHEWIHTTYLDNINNLDPKKILEWERARVTDPDYYNHHILGQWRAAWEGVIFDRFSTDPTDWTSEPAYGLDWGFASDPTAVIEVQIRGRDLKLKEILYTTGLTNREISQHLLNKGISQRASIIADSAEPKSISEMKSLGWSNLQGAKKGPGSVISGIKLIKDYNLFVDPGSTNLIRELETYRWKEGTEIPIDSDNHLIDALRYVLSSTGKGKYNII